MSIKYRLYDYELWGNIHDGFEINSVIPTSTVLEFEQKPTEAQLIRALKESGWIKYNVRHTAIEIGWSTTEIMFKDKRQRYGCEPLFELREEK